MTSHNQQLADSLYSLAQMILVAAQLHRQSTEMLITLLSAGVNVSDQVQALRVYEELYCGYLTRMSALADTLRFVVLNKAEQTDEHD